MSKPSELKPCPFCGKQPEHDFQNDIIKCCGNMMFISNWNTRVVDEGKKECPKCKGDGWEGFGHICLQCHGKGSITTELNGK